ncbi:MAG: metalloregulator ArsR/SmtB family transcription factor [Desulfohalobiaceae bacterium]|nr:metalloregulator ArsR/SmtB family transcription factor [Desulfohalobiaceae bacterium]
MDIENMETLLKALSERTRLRILALLTQGELRVCDLMATLNMPQSTVSRHLAYLKNAHWIKARRKGAWMYYHLKKGEYPLQHKLWDMLDRYLHQLPEVRRDLHTLRSYLAKQLPSSA